MAGDSKISVGIASLPCIACQADFPGHSGALARVSVDGKTREKGKNIEAILQRVQLLLEHFENKAP